MIHKEDMTNTNTAANIGNCADCGAHKPLTARGLCKPCDEEVVFCPSDAAEQFAARAITSDVVVSEAPVQLSGSVAELAADLTAIGQIGAANAAVQGIGSLQGGQLRGVGFATAEGYTTALRNGVKANTHAAYLTQLRTRFGMTSADLAALNLPGPMAESALPVGAGVTHTPAGYVAGSAGIFSRPKSERQLVVGAVATDAKETTRKLDRADLIAGAIAEGHGVLVCWSGSQRQRKLRLPSKITRGAIVAALESIGRASIAPNAKSAHAQAGRAVQVLTANGYHVRAATREDYPELESNQCRWTVGKINHTGKTGDEFGFIALTITLTDDALTFEGDEHLSHLVTDDFNARTATDVYQGADVTQWLGNVLRRAHGAVEYGLGWYVPAKHRAAAAQLCAAIADTGFGTSWVGGRGRPALPIATCDELRDGILAGLSEEVESLLDRLATERDNAKTERKAGDIGAKRAGTFLTELREINRRIDAYGLMMGAERIAAAREQVRLAIVELESVLGDEYTGIGARFALIAEECAFDPAKTTK